MATRPLVEAMIQPGTKPYVLEHSTSKACVEFTATVRHLQDSTETRRSCVVKVKHGFEVETELLQKQSWPQWGRDTQQRATPGTKQLLHFMRQLTNCRQSHQQHSGTWISATDSQTWALYHAVDLWGTWHSQYHSLQVIVWVNKNCLERMGLHWLWQWISHQGPIPVFQ